MLRKQHIRVFIIIAIISIGLTTSIMGITDRVSAQFPEETWSVPTNLSNSSGTTSPAIVIASNGAIHIVWQDAYRGTVYSGFDGAQWSPPVALFFPFSSPGSAVQLAEEALTGFVPTLVADPFGLVHAFWTNEDNQLFHSSVLSDAFSNPGAWSGAAQLAESAVDFDAIVDSVGRIHLSYVRNLESADFPAGIYYRVTNDRGLNWSLPTLLYESPYLRAVTNVEANVDLAVDQGGGTLYISWDNQPRKQVYFTQSTNGGLNWSQFQLIDSPTEDNPAPRPFNIRAIGYKTDVMLLWQNGDPAISCVQYFQLSTDGGNTWSERQVMLDEISGCSQDIHFFTQNDLLIMMVTVQGQVYLQAWNGSQWSLPQVQGLLSGFEDPQNFELVQFGCRQPAQNLAGDVIIVGCDTGVGGDIWLTSRSIGDIDSWFPLPGSWTDPTVITISQEQLNSLQVISDQKGGTHAFWISQDISSIEDKRLIYHASSDGGSWTTPAIAISSEGNIDDFYLAKDDSDKLLVVWREGESGNLYLSWALSDLANAASQWSTPSLIPTLHSTSRYAVVASDAEGTIYIAYVMPANEGRGVYLITTEDLGLSWEPPLLVFDAAAREWEFVGPVELGVSKDGNINLMLSRQPLPGDSLSYQLIYSYSTDRGQNWSTPEILYDLPVQWGGIIASDRNISHRFWQKADTNISSIWHAFSLDAGKNWNETANITEYGGKPGLADMVADAGGNLHHVLVIEESSKEMMKYWTWTGDRWHIQDIVNLSADPKFNMSGIGVSATTDNMLRVLYVEQEVVSSSEFQYRLLEIHRSIDLPAIMITPVPIDFIERTPQADNTVEVINLSATQTPVAITSLPAIPTEQEISDVSSSDDIHWTGLVVSGLFAAMLLLFLLGVGIWWRKRA